MKKSLLIPLLVLIYANFGLAQGLLVISGSVENLRPKETNTKDIENNELPLTFKVNKGKIKLKEKKKTTKLKIKANGELKDPDTKNPNGSNSGTPHILEFSNSGELVSSPPKLINNGDQIIFQIRAPDKSNFEDRVTNLGDRYYETITNLEKYKDIFKTFYGIEEDTIKKHQGFYLYQLEKLTTENISPENSAYLSYLIRKIEINKDFQDIKSENPSDELPDLNSLLKPHYSVTYRLFKDGEQVEVGKEETLELRKEGKDTIRYKSNSILVKDSDLLEFELRESNPMDNMVTDWYIEKNFNKDLLEGLSDELVKTSKEINSESFNKNIKELNKIVKEIENQPSIDHCKRGLELIECLSNQSDKLLAELKKKDTKEWIKSWIWLTKGVPKINPFAHQAQSIVPSNLAAEKRKLAIYEELLAKNSIEFSESKEVMDLLEKMAQIKEKIAGESPKPEFLRDNLLYRGELGLSTSDSIYYMRHHNVKNNFLPMNREPISSINEKERILVLVHNKNPGTNYTIDPVIKVIHKDNSPLGENIEVISGNIDLNKLLGYFTPKGEEKIMESKSSDEGFDTCLDFGNNYYIFKKNFNGNLKFIKSLQLGPSLPLKLPSDKTAKLESKIIYFEQPSLDSIPYVVNYPIKDGDDSVLYTGSYRATKLYRFRAKVGPMYSLLNRNDYTINDNGITLSKNPHQFDITAGVQYYLTGFDIRERKPSWKVKSQPWLYGSFIYLGMGLKNNPIENWVLGLGYEPYPGATLIVGGHFGPNEKLHLNENGKPNIQNTIKGSLFFSLGFDLSVFSSFFGISGIFN